MDIRINKSGLKFIHSKVPSSGNNCLPQVLVSNDYIQGNWDNCYHPIEEGSQGAGGILNRYS